MTARGDTDVGETNDEFVLSILVVSRTAEHVSRLLEAVESSQLDVPFEVLCSWNGEVADIERIERPRGMAVRVIEQRPYNFARNNNGLAEAARGTYLLFINDDVIPDRRSIPRALTHVAQPSVGMVGANLRYTDNRLQHAGIFFREDGTPFHRLKHAVQWDDAEVIADMFVPAVTGAFIMMRREEFERVRFDENFRVCGEDIALNLRFREKFDREILYAGDVTAIHIENATRKKTKETKTPPEDMERIHAYARRAKDGKPLTDVRRPRVRIVTEKPGWILHRKAEEIQKSMGSDSVRINEDWPEADIHYYINYGYFRQRPSTGIVVANFTHYDPDLHADTFVSAAHEVDHCVSVSELTSDVLRSLGIPDYKITTIPVGADASFVPRLTVGIVGRVYAGGRKGEDLVKALLDDEEICRQVRIVAAKDGWGAPVWQFDDPADFYRAIDYLLVPSRLEGGPVPFMEALACGTMSIAPRIGVVPEFPHVPYEVGNLESLKKVLSDLAERHVLQRTFLTEKIRGYNWQRWAVEHEKLFRRLLWKGEAASQGGYEFPGSNERTEALPQYGSNAAL